MKTLNEFLSEAVLNADKVIKLLKKLDADDIDQFGYTISFTDGMKPFEIDLVDSVVLSYRNYSAQNDGDVDDSWEYRNIKELEKIIKKELNS